MASSSAFAADVVRVHAFDTSNLGEPVSWEEISRNLNGSVSAANNMSTQAMPRMSAKSKSPAKVIATPASIDELVAKSWDGSYTGMLNNNAGVHQGDASFVYNEAYEELDLMLPDFQYGGLYVGYQNGNLIIYNRVDYTQAGDIALCPINPATGAIINKQVSVPFNDETGDFEFPDDFAWGLCAVNSATGQAVGYYWAGAEFSLKASTGDYKLDVTIEDECTPDNKFKISVATGKDVAKTKMLVLNYDADVEECADYIGQLGTEIQAGDVVIDPVKNHALLSIEGPMTNSSHASVVIATYDADGNIQRKKSVSMIVVLDDDKEWRSVGKMEYVDGLFSQYYKNFAHSQEVELQQQVDAPGIYRLVNPYSEFTVTYQDEDIPAEHNANCHHYFIIDTTDPEWVAIPFSVSGLDYGGDGILAFGTCAALGYTKEAGTQQGMVSGSMSGQKITFPAKSIFCHEQFYNPAGRWSYMTGAPVEITLPDIDLDLKVVNANDEPVASASVKMGDAAYATDANGAVSIKVPFEVGYFGNVNLKVQKADAAEAAVAIDLKGAKTTYTYKYDDGAGVDDVAVDAANAPVEFYNLQGVRVDNPAAGQLVIKRQGGKVSKIIVK